MVETTIDLEAVEHHEFRIKSSYDSELEGTECVRFSEKSVGNFMRLWLFIDMHTKLQDIFEQLEPEARRVADALGLEFEKKLKFEKNSQYGWIMRLTRKVWYSVMCL